MENSNFELKLETFEIENHILVTGRNGKKKLIKEMIKKNIKNEQTGIVLGSFKKEYNDLEEETNGYLKIYGTNKSNYKMNILAVPKGVQPKKHFKAMAEAFSCINNYECNGFECILNCIEIFCEWSYDTDVLVTYLLEELKNDTSLIIQEKCHYIYDTLINRSLISISDCLETKMKKLCISEITTEKKINEEILAYNSKIVTLKHVVYLIELFKIKMERKKFDLKIDKKQYNRFLNDMEKLFKNEEFVNNFCYNEDDQNLVTDFLENKGISVLDLNSFAKDSKLRGIINYILTADVYNFYSSFKGSKKRTVYLEDFSYNYYNFKYSKSKVNESKEYILRDIYENLLCCGRGAGIKVVVSALSKGDVSEIIQANCSENIYLNSNYPDSNKIQRELQIGEGLYYNGREEPITFEYSSNIKIDKNKIRRKNGTKMGY